MFLTQPLNDAAACTDIRRRANNAGENTLTNGITCNGIVNQHALKFHLMDFREQAVKSKDLLSNNSVASHCCVAF